MLIKEQRERLIGFDSFIEKQGGPFRPVPGNGLGIKAAVLLCFLSRHNGPVYVLGIFQKTGLDGFVFSGLCIQNFPSMPAFQP